MTSKILLEIAGIWGLFVCFWPHDISCRILVPQPGIEPMSPTVEVWSPNHWTTGEVPGISYLCIPAVNSISLFKKVLMKHSLVAQTVKHLTEMRETWV